MSEKTGLLCARADYRIDSELQASFSLSHFSLCSVDRTADNISFKASTVDANGGVSL